MLKVAKLCPLDDPLMPSVACGFGVQMPNDSRRELEVLPSCRVVSGLSNLAANAESPGTDAEDADPGASAALFASSSSRITVPVLSRASARGMPSVKSCPSSA